MTTLDEARRRTTDRILADAMTESGNHDAERAAEAGKPLHFDPYADLDGHRAAASGAVRAEEALGQVGGGAVGKGASAAADAAIHAAFGAALRGGLGAAFQGLGSAALVHELFWSCALRAELGNERPDVLDGLVERARRDRAHLEPAAVQVRG